MRIIFNSTTIPEPGINSGQELSQCSCWLKWFNLEVVQSTHQIMIYPRFLLQAKWLSRWKWCAGWTGFCGFHCSEYLHWLLYKSVAMPFAYPNEFSAPTTSLCALVFVRSGVQVRSGFWWSIVYSSGLFSGGGAPGTLSLSRRISCLSNSMAIQVHRPTSNHDGSVQSLPAGGTMLSVNSPGFIEIGWYCWLWASSRFLLNNLHLQMKHLRYFQWVLTIFEKRSQNTYSDESL